MSFDPINLPKLGEEGVTRAEILHQSRVYLFSTYYLTYSYICQTGTVRLVIRRHLSQIDSGDTLHAQARLRQNLTNLPVVKPSGPLPTVGMPLGLNWQLIRCFSIVLDRRSPSFTPPARTTVPMSTWLAIAQGLLAEQNSYSHSR